MRRTSPMLLPIALSIAGCASDRSFPSLTPRPIERLAAATEPDPPAPASAAAPAASTSPALEQAIAALIARAGAAAEARRELAAELAPAIMAGTTAEPDSEAWVDAQQALSALDAATAPIAGVRAELDALALSRIDGASAADAAALADAGRRIDELIADQPR